MAWTEKTCDQADNINPFLANALAGETRQAFVAHVAACDLCAGLLQILREDERLTRAPLTAAERGQIALIVRQARERLAEHLESGHQRRGRRPGRPAAPPAPIFFLWRGFTQWQALFWALLASLGAAAAAWWWFNR